MPGNTQHNDTLIDRYLNRQLSDAERTAFELMMLEDENLFARVQLLDAFKTALTLERKALATKRELLALPFGAWLQQPFSLAAAVLVLGLGLQVANGVATRPEAGSAAVGIDTVFVLEATRGASTPALAGAPPYLFQADAGLAAAGSRVALTLRAADGAEVMHVAGLPVDASGWARVLYDQPLSGTYTLELLPADGDTPRRFTLVVKD